MTKGGHNLDDRRPKALITDNNAQKLCWKWSNLRDIRSYLQLTVHCFRNDAEDGLCYCLLVLCTSISIEFEECKII
jgi:hypothetical protein